HEVVAAVPAPPRFPPLAHRAGTIGTVERLGRGVEIIAARNHQPAILLAREVNGQPLKAARVRHGLAEHAEPGHAPVGECRHADVGEAARVRYLEGVPRVAAQPRPGDDPDPLGFWGVQFFRAWVALDTARLDGALLGEIAGEKARIDDDQADDPRHAETDQRPVVPRSSAAFRLPAVDDLAAVAVPPWLEGRVGRIQQVLLITE